MSRTEKGRVMTAHRLGDGEAVFLTRSGLWSRTIDDAVLALEPLAVAALENRANDEVKASRVTGPYLFDAERVNGRIRASHIRERIRSLGPSVRGDLGKQAEGAGGAFPAAGA